MNQEYNLRKLLEEDLYTLVVPEMQRDYVWSVTSDNVYKFLKMIHESDESQMGFIYAFRQDNAFCLIDGQQRLTTLVLLAFYLALRDEKDWTAFQHMMIRDGKLRFTYRVRHDAERFLNNLFTGTRCTYNEIRSLQAKNWNNDTTVENMIEALHIIDRYVQMALFSNQQELNYENIVSNIKFFYSDIEETMQGRELYITMNSCGQPLARHERLKPFIVGSDLEKSEEWNKWEDQLYRITKSNKLDKRMVDVAMGNFLRIVYELKTGREPQSNWETAAESYLQFQDVKTYFNAFHSLKETYSKEVNSLFYPAEIKDKKRHFRKMKALLQIAVMDSPNINQKEERDRMSHLVTQCLRGKRMVNKDLLPFLYKYKNNGTDLYTFIDTFATDSIVTSCLHAHEIRKVRLIKRGTKRTEQLFLKAEQLNLYNTDDYYCLLNALWDEKFSGELTQWTENDDEEFSRRMETFKFLFNKKWMALEVEHKVGLIDNAFLARYLLSLNNYCYYIQEGLYRDLGCDSIWSKMLSHKKSCAILSQMIKNLYTTSSEACYHMMQEQIEQAWKHYKGQHDARFYLLKYPNSLQAYSRGWNRIWIDLPEENTTQWDTFNIGILSSECKWSGNAIFLFESLLAHAAYKLEICTNEWSPVLSNGIRLENGRNKHGWRIYDNQEDIEKRKSPAAIADYLKSRLTDYKKSMELHSLKEEDTYVLVEIKENQDLIEEGCELLRLLKDYPAT